MENTELIRSLNEGLALEMPCSASYEEIHARLSEYMNDLIKTNFEKLVTYLYRIDVSEAKLKSLLQHFPEQDAGNIIASLIIERQEQKFKLRQHSDSNRNSRKEDAPDEEEKW